MIELKQNVLARMLKSYMLFWGRLERSLVFSHVKEPIYPTI